MTASKSNPLMEYGVMFHSTYGVWPVVEHSSIVLSMRAGSPDALSNRGLVYCMEFLEESLEDWLGDELEAYGEDDYLVFDCPGQIELYTNTSVFRSFVRYLQGAGWQVGFPG